MGADRISFSRVCDASSGNEPGVPLLPRARVWRFAFLFGESGRMHLDGIPASGRLDLRVAHGVLHSAARYGNGDLQIGNAAGLALFQSADDQSPLYDRRVDAR